MKKKPTQDGQISSNNKVVDSQKIINKEAEKTIEELNQYLINAIKTGNSELIQLYIEKGANINISNANGNTALTLASQDGHIELLKYLIKKGANVNQKCSSGQTALLVACRGFKADNIKEIVEILLKHKADANLYKIGEDGPLHYAAMFGHFEAVKLLVVHGAEINVPGSYKRTPLIYAAADAAMPEMVKFLIENGADLTAQNEAGENALFELITREKSNSEVAEILIDSGLNIHIKSKYYGTALHWAAFCGKTNIVELLIKKGANVNGKDKNGEPPIIKAMSQRKVETVKVLFELGADVNSKSQFGWSLMEYVTELGDKEFLNKILKNTGKGKIQGNAALCEAAKKGDLVMVEMLIESGSHPDERERWASETPLMKACYYGKIEIVKYLLNKGADIKAADYRGNTALHQAAWSGHLEIVKFLLDNGSNINEKNKLNWNALMQACVEGHFELAKYLLELGSPTNEIDKEKGATALTIAKVSNFPKLVRLLKSFGAKERQIKMRKKDEAYFSIFDCDICAFLPDKKDLGNAETTENFEGLEILFSESSHPDRYMDDTDLIKKCVNCGTHYYHYHSIDTEDAFVGGPRITHEIQRFNLLRLRETFKYFNKTAELLEFESRYPILIELFINKLKHQSEQINPLHLAHIIESITDYFVERNDWESLNEILLQHSNPIIVLDTASDLILMYGEIARNGPYQPFTHYKSISKELQLQFKPLFEKNLETFKICIQKFEISENPQVKHRFKSVMDSAKYYKLII